MLAGDQKPAEPGRRTSSSLTDVRGNGQGEASGLGVMRIRVFKDHGWDEAAIRVGGICAEAVEGQTGLSITARLSITAPADNIVVAAPNRFRSEDSAVPLTDSYHWEHRAQRVDRC